MTQEKTPLPHFFLPDTQTKPAYTSNQTGRDNSVITPRVHKSHAQKLGQQVDGSFQSQKTARSQLSASQKDDGAGYYLEFTLKDDNDGIVKSLDYRKRKEDIEVVSCKKLQDGSLKAVVHVPQSCDDVFQKRISDYGEKVTSAKLFSTIEEVHAANTMSFFTDPADMFPSMGEEICWEVWLRKDDANAVVDKFLQYAEANKIRNVEGEIEFAERIVKLCIATPEQLGALVIGTDLIAELRKCTDNPEVFFDHTPNQWAMAAADLIDHAPEDSPVVCVLDTGTSRQHPLLNQAYQANALQTYDPNWGTDDRQGHGTAMAGIALYGDLVYPLQTTQRIQLKHGLESVKILPDNSKNEYENYPYITAEAITSIEVPYPHRPRVFNLSITNKDDHNKGRPTTWSAELDKLAFEDFEGSRLITVSAGNIRKNYPKSQYLVINDLTPIENPAQAWNVLTVGAMTNKSDFNDPNFPTLKAVAPLGDLCPSSRTSVMTDWNGGCIKPEVVFEGGNRVAEKGDGSQATVKATSLQLMTTGIPSQNLLDDTGETSAATAQASKMAAEIMAQYPWLWPETVRGLIVHSARWTSAMEGHLRNPNAKTQKYALLRRYGFGVPDLNRALNSFEENVSMVIQGQIKPFKEDMKLGDNGRLYKNGIKTDEMGMHRFPWPKKALSDLLGADVRIRITLSYFIEPNPGERGWRTDHSYRSHGLRFELKHNLESLEDFHKRISRQALDEGEEAPNKESDDNWYFGQKAQTRGSIHSDYWEGSASDLADRDYICVYPVNGWWRTRKKLEAYEKSARYALIVTLEAPVGTQLYSEIQNVIAVANAVETLVTT